MYPEIYDLTNKKLAILNEAFDLKIAREINTWPTLYFDIPFNSSKWRYIKNEMRVYYNDEWFVIKQVGGKRDEQGTLRSTIECHSIASDLNTKMNQVIGGYCSYRGDPDDVYPDLIPLTLLPRDMLEVILENTGWEVGEVTVDNRYRTMVSEWESVPSNLSTAAERYNGYLEYDTTNSQKRVHLLKDMGPDIPDKDNDFTDRGYVIQYKKNAQDISRDSESMEFITRLYVFGDEDMSINDVDNGYRGPECFEGAEAGEENPYGGIFDGPFQRPLREVGQSFIENFQYFLALGHTQEEIDADIDTYGEASKFIKVGRFNDSDYRDPGYLYIDAKEKLDIEMSVPKVTYSTTFTHLSSLLGFTHEALQFGDWVTIFDEGWNLDVRVRIIKMTEFPGFPEKTAVELSNARETYGSALAKTVEVAGKISKNREISSLLSHYINTFKTTISDPYGRIIIYDTHIDAVAVEVDEYGDEVIDPETNAPIPTGRRVRITPGGIELREAFDDPFVTAITGAGILAHTIICSDLYALSVEDGYTKLRSHGLQVYDSLDELRVAIGQYETDQFGLLVHGGSIKITGGGLPDSEIGSISASKFIGGTITAEQAIYLGDTNFELNAPLQQLIIRDVNEDRRVILGDHLSDYGLYIYGPSDQLVLSADSTGLQIFLEDSEIKDANEYIKLDNTGLRVYQPPATPEGEKTLRVHVGNPSTDIYGLKIYGENAELMINEFGIDPRFMRYGKNMLWNSSFELPEVNSIPSYWTGGLVSSDSSWMGSYSMKLAPGGSSAQTSEAWIQPSWLGNKTMRMSFSQKIGSIVCNIYGASTLDGPGTLIHSESYAAPAIFEFAQRTFAFEPGVWEWIYVEFVNEGATEDTYIDAGILELEFTGMWPSVYTDGPHSLGVEALPDGVVSLDKILEQVLDSIEEYMEYTVANWNKDGVEYTYVQQYTDEPSVYVGLQGDDVVNALDLYSFIMVAEHVKDATGNYVGVKVYPQGTSIPTTLDGKITIHAICKGLVDEEEIS
jgi:hypothetical protein